MANIIIGDTHGNHQVIKDILTLTGAISSDGTKNPEHKVYSIGDLIHCGSTSKDDDLETMKIAHFFDSIIIGNHELPLFKSGFPGWYDMSEPHEETSHIYMELYGEGIVKPFDVVDGYLLSHAGIHPRLVIGVYETSELRTTEKMCDTLTEMFNQRLNRDPFHSDSRSLFDFVDCYRGGFHCDDFGGPQWGDWNNFITFAHENRIPQIVGHTPHSKIQSTKAGVKVFNIDCCDHVTKSAAGIKIENGKMEFIYAGTSQLGETK